MANDWLVVVKPRAKRECELMRVENSRSRLPRNSRPLSGTLIDSRELSLIDFEPAQIFHESWREFCFDWRLSESLAVSIYCFFFQRAQIKKGKIIWRRIRGPRTIERTTRRLF